MGNYLIGHSGHSSRSRCCLPIVAMDSHGKDMGVQTQDRGISVQTDIVRAVIISLQFPIIHTHSTGHKKVCTWPKWEESLNIACWTHLHKALAGHLLASPV